ncbi:hypothetical protein HT136_16790 [Novosphingobium profundi]|uniref:hypothetical protein n=1 Tax=Novosphingobium profundi TaxID=1774954 RepID=UPI001BD95BBC|nr:hypothetical protein [Novosphingobium profundi]
MSADILRFPVPPSRLALRLEAFAQSRSVLLAIWALFLALRVAMLLLDSPPGWVNSALGFDLEAQLVASGQVDLRHVAAPGWQLVLALVYGRFGSGTVTLGLFNLACALLGGAMTLALGRRIYGNEAGARLALLLHALLPGALLAVPLALPDTFATLLVQAACWTLITRTTLYHTATAGLLLGLAAFMAPMTLLLVPLLFAIDALRRPLRGKDRLRLPGELALVFTLAALPLGAWNLLRASPTPFALDPAGSLPGALSRLRLLWLETGSPRAPVSLLERVAQGWNAGLLALLALALVVMVVRRLRDGQRWAGWWLVPYGLALCPPIWALLFAGIASPLAATMPVAGLGAGWLISVAWQALAERRGLHRPTLH